MGYDTIIVGAGSAGAIIATRLTEEPERSVLLIEAGPDYPTFEDIPDEVKYGYGRGYPRSREPVSDHRWSFIARYTDEAMPGIIPRGKVVGGSSAVNAQIFLRGVPEDYDTWASLGNDRWSFQEVLPYFGMIETDMDFSGDFHGRDGPILVRRFKTDQWNEDQKAFYDSALAYGFPDCPDHNAPETTGVGPTPLNNPNGVRWSTAIGYLSDARHRPNLTIMPNGFVRKIVFDGKLAVGLEVDLEGETVNLMGQNIILAGGAIGSPHLLMLSGVGPSRHICDFGIPIIHDLPGVGENLRDHPQVRTSWRVRDHFYRESGKPVVQVTLRYTATGSHLSNDMLIHPATNVTVGNRVVGHGVSEEHGLAMVICLDLELSYGNLRLRDSDPYIQPLLDYNFLEDDFDKVRMREGIKISVELSESNVWANLVKERVTPTDDDLKSDEALDSWMKHWVQTSHHISGTCKMGPESDPMAVVNQYGKVYGLENIRVADASVMPNCIRANTNATSMMIGERIVALIREGF